MGIVGTQVVFLEVYSQEVAKNKMKFLTQYGMHAYFSHKADEYGVYFFDPFYYELKILRLMWIRDLSKSVQNRVERLCHIGYEPYRCQKNSMLKLESLCPLMDTIMRCVIRIMYYQRLMLTLRKARWMNWIWKLRILKRRQVKNCLLN